MPVVTFNSGKFLFFAYISAIIIFTCFYFTAESPKVAATATGNDPAFVQVAGALADAAKSFKDAVAKMIGYVAYIAMFNIGYFAAQFLAKNIDSFQLFSLSLFSSFLSGLSLLLIFLLPGEIAVYFLFIPFTGVSFYLSKRAGIFKTGKGI